MNDDPALPSSPAALRNREAIASVLAQWLPPAGLVLELASGTGEHVVHFARSFSQLEWQPSDRDEAALAPVAARVARAGLANLRQPLVIDASSSDWPVARADAVLSINMVHISPWPASLGLLDGAARLLGPGAPLVLYGPWLEAGVATAASNLDFDSSLRERDPDWGLRSVEAFSIEAEARGFGLEERRSMPANNLMLLFRRSA